MKELQDKFDMNELQVKFDEYTSARLSWEESFDMDMPVETQTVYFAELCKKRKVFGELFYNRDFLTLDDDLEFEEFLVKNGPFAS